MVYFNTFRFYHIIYYSNLNIFGSERRFYHNYFKVAGINWDWSVQGETHGHPF